MASDLADSWDDFFLWDHIVVDRSSPPPIVEPWTTLAAGGRRAPRVSHHC